MLLRNRRDMHRHVVEVLTRIDPGRINDIARHYLEARERAKALPWLVESAERGARAYSTPEAIQYSDEATGILEEGVPDRTLAALAYKRRGCELQLFAEIERADANTLIYMTEFDRALPRLEETIELAKALGNKQYEAGMKSWSLPVYHLRNGDVQAARRSPR